MSFWSSRQSLLSLIFKKNLASSAKSRHSDDLITLGRSFIVVWDKLIRNKSTFRLSRREITRSFNEEGPKVDKILILSSVVGRSKNCESSTNWCY